MFELAFDEKKKREIKDRMYFLKLLEESIVTAYLQEHYLPNRGREINLFTSGKSLFSLKIFHADPCICV